MSIECWLCGATGCDCEEDLLLLNDVEVCTPDAVYTVTLNTQTASLENLKQAIAEAANVEYSPDEWPSTRPEPSTHEHHQCSCDLASQTRREIPEAALLPIDALPSLKMTGVNLAPFDGSECVLCRTPVNQPCPESTAQELLRATCKNKRPGIPLEDPCIERMHIPKDRLY